MVRPKEQSLSQEELEAVRQQVSLPYTVEVDLQSGKIADMFGRCCGKAVSKEYLVECNWILEPLVTLHPKAALATDSLWELLKILAQGKSPVPVPEVVALDLRRLLGSLKKRKRQLRSESKRRGLDPDAWLERTNLDPKLMKLLQLIETPSTSSGEMDAADDEEVQVEERLLFFTDGSMPEQNTAETMPNAAEGRSQPANVPAGDMAPELADAVARKRTACVWVIASQSILFLPT